MGCDMKGIQKHVSFTGVREDVVELDKELGSSFMRRVLFPRKSWIKRVHCLRQMFTLYQLTSLSGTVGTLHYRKPVIVRRTRNYIVVHQYGGYDV